MALDAKAEFPGFPELLANERRGDDRALRLLDAFSAPIVQGEESRSSGRIGTEYVV
ncbi:unnamed protein product [Victoria cruziana]